MVQHAMKLDSITQHTPNSGKIHEAVPEILVYEGEMKVDQDFSATHREQKTVNFDDLEQGTGAGNFTEWDEVIVSVEPGEYVAWKMVKEKNNDVYSRMIPWDRVIEVVWRFPTVEDKDNTSESGGGA